MDNIDGYLGVDDLTDESVQAVIELLLVLARDDLDMLNEVREVKADEIDSWIFLHPL